MSKEQLTNVIYSAIIVICSIFAISLFFKMIYSEREPEPLYEPPSIEISEPQENLPILVYEVSILRLLHPDGEFEMIISVSDEGIYNELPIEEIEAIGYYLVDIATPCLPIEIAPEMEPEDDKEPNPVVLPPCPSCPDSKG